MREPSQNEIEFQSEFEKLIEKYKIEFRVVVVPDNWLSRIIQSLLGRWMKSITKIYIAEQHELPQSFTTTSDSRPSAGQETS